MKNQPFIAPLAGLMLGILFADFLPFLSADGISLLGLFILIILCIYFGYKRNNSLQFLFIFLLIGWIHSSYFNSFHPIPHYQIEKESWIKLEIKETYKPSAKFRKYKARILQIDSTYSENYALLYWKRENQELFSQDEIWINTKIIQNKKPLNPHQFDYSKWLGRQNIHYTIFSDTVYWKEKTGNSIASKTSQYKRKAHRQLQENGYTKSSADLIGAMLLGDRTEMDAQTEENYRKTGVVHILSISGLHVMMVYSIFMILLYPLIYLRNGKIIRILLSLVLIWSFVIFVGFQPPVLRSAVMISVYYITISFHRKPNVYHTLAVSAFILLFINPNFLFDVGFQLSFSAVFFIVYLHPIYQKTFRPKSKLSKTIVGFIGTSISAQLGTFPFTALYFHQTSGLFLAGNLVMIAASYFMMAGGAISMILLEMNMSFSIWIQVFNGFIEFCNSYIAWLSGFDTLVFENISFDGWESFLILCGIIWLKFIWTQPNFKRILIGFGIIFLFQIHQIQTDYKTSRTKELIVFHQTRNSIIGIRNGRELDVYIQNISDSTTVNQYILRPYMLKEGIEKFQLKEMDSVFHTHYFKSENSLYFEGIHLFIHSENSKPISLNADYILVQNNSDLVLDSIDPKTQIIVDGSNYPNHLNESEIEIWKTRNQGAKIIERK